MKCGDDTFVVLETILKELSERTSKVSLRLSTGASLMVDLMSRKKESGRRKSGSSVTVTSATLWAEAMSYHMTL